MLNELIVKVGADIQDFLTKMKKLESELQDISDSFQAIGEKMSTFVTLPMLAAGAASIKLASDMGETLNKVDVAFGESANEVLKWSKISVNQMGLAGGTALDAAALFGDMATSMGIARDDAAGMAMSLTQLGADLASFKNIPIQQAMYALNGVFTGETESLKMLGVVMTQTQLQAFALTQGITKQVEKMTEAEMVSLRYAFVLDRTKNAQGDFARTSEGSANQMRIFTESLKELGVQFGEIILPTFTAFITKINEALKGMMDLSPEMRKTIIVFGALAAIIGPVLITLSLMIPAMTTIATAAGAMFSALKYLTAATTWAAALNTLTVSLVSLRVALVALAANPVTAIVAAFGAVVYAGMKMYENWDELSKKSIFLAVTVGSVAGQLATAGAYLAKNWDAVQLAFEMILEKIQNNFRYLLFKVNPIMAVLINAGIELYKRWDIIAEGLQLVFDKVAGYYRFLLLKTNPILGLIINAGVELYKNWEAIKNGLKITFEQVHQFAKENFGGVAKIVQYVGGVFETVFNWIRQNTPFVNEAINSISQSFSDFSKELERRRQVKALEELHEETKKNVWISDYMSSKNREQTGTIFDMNDALANLIKMINEETEASKNSNDQKDKTKDKLKELAEQQKQTVTNLGNAIERALSAQYQKQFDLKVQEVKKFEMLDIQKTNDLIKRANQVFENEIAKAKEASKVKIDQMKNELKEKLKLQDKEFLNEIEFLEGIIKAEEDKTKRENEQMQDEARLSELNRKKEFMATADNAKALEMIAKKNAAAIAKTELEADKKSEQDKEEANRIRQMQELEANAKIERARLTHTYNQRLQSAKDQEAARKVVADFEYAKVQDEIDLNSRLEKIKESGLIKQAEIELKYAEKSAAIDEKLKVDIASIDKDFEKEKASTLESIAKEQSAHDRILLLRSRDNNIKTAQQAIDAAQKRARTQREALEEEARVQLDAEDVRLQNEISALNDLKGQVDSHYKTRLEDLDKFHSNKLEKVKSQYTNLMNEENLQEEVRRTIVGKNQDKMIELLKTYNPSWLEIGRTYGQQLIDGLMEKKASMEQTVKEMLKLVPTPKATPTPKVAPPPPPESSAFISQMNAIVSSNDNVTNLFMDTKLVASSIAPAMVGMLNTKVPVGNKGY